MPHPDLAQGIERTRAYLDRYCRESYGPLALIRQISDQIPASEILSTLEDVEAVLH